MREGALFHHVLSVLTHYGAAHAVCPPPPCGEELGMRVARFCAGGATEIFTPPAFAGLRRATREELKTEFAARDEEIFAGLKDTP